MAYKTVDVPVEIALDEFSDDEIIKYMEQGGYVVSYKDSQLEDAIWHLSRGDLESTILEIERKIPKLKGLGDLIKKETQNGSV